MKIQQMAFVLVAFMIFFGMVFVMFVSIRMNSLEKEAELLKDDESRKIVQSIAKTPELLFTSTTLCSNCIDLDKAMVLAGRESYARFWNLDYLVIEKIYPISKKVECSLSNYPNCNSLSLLKNKEIEGSVYSSFIGLCRWDGKKDGHYVCELGRILASGKGVQNE
jgi:hypothetical protein